MLNNICLEGRTTKDPELRYTPSGKAVVNFTLANNRTIKGENNCDFINVAIWGKTAENFANYIKKGDLVSVIGQLRTNSYIKNDEKRIATFVLGYNVNYLSAKKDAFEQHATNISTEVKDEENIDEVIENIFSNIDEHN